MRSTPRATGRDRPLSLHMSQNTERTMHMRRVRLSALLIGLIAVFALVAAGCGGSDSEGGSSSGDTGGSAPAKGKQGGDLTFLAAADVDYLDPGQSYYTFGYQVLYSTNRPLYSFSSDQPDKPQA